MEQARTRELRVGQWRVNLESGEIRRNGKAIRLDVRSMRLLVCLAERARQVVSIDELLKQVWGEVNVSPDSVYQAVASLRRQLGDDAKEPRYIETVPRMGYRMVAKVSRWAEEATEAGSASGTGGSRGWLIAGATVLCAAIVGAFLFFGKAGRQNQPGSAAIAAEPSARSVMVLPFLDLTEGMKEEEFADGMTEELIDKLSRVPGLRVPTATSSFYFKGKQLPLGEIAKSLGVAYVVDGSVRRSGGQVRIAARLVRAENGYVVWTETYDRPFTDIVMVQDEIAGEVAKALEKQWRVLSGK
jgi:TolB-like protein/DNA-binding winged helix-turn-helix (wHTH) protein